MIGHIKDLSIERESGQVIFAIVSFGGFLGIGKRLHALPWSILQFDAEKHGYIVPIDTKALRNAPHYDDAELEDLGGPHRTRERAHLLEYYGNFAPPAF